MYSDTQRLENEMAKNVIRVSWRPAFSQRCTGTLVGYTRGNEFHGIPAGWPKVKAHTTNVVTPINPASLTFELR